jgi:hypothetical protein
MPVQKYSAMDPGGTWQMDARDQTAMWNADRGDRINMWQTNRADQRGQDDWRKEVALKQLGLSERMYTGGREDSAAERAAKYGYMGEELGMRRQRMESDNDYRKRMIALQESDPNRQAGAYALEKLKGRDAKMATFEAGLDPKKFGFEGESAEAFRGLVGLGGGEAAIPVISEAMRRAMKDKYKPQDRKDTAEDARIEQALAIINQFEGNTNLTPQQFNALNKAKATAQAAGADAGIGLESRAADPVRAAQEKIDAVSRKADELAGGVTGYASEQDINDLSDMVSELKRDLQDIGYTDDQIQQVVAELEKKISRTGGAPTWQRALTSLAGGPVGLAANLFGVGGGINPEERARILGGQR